MKKLLVSCALAVVAYAANAGPPATSGIVTRDGYFFARFFVDEASGMSAVVGTDIVAFCSGSADFTFISYSDKDIQEGLRLSTLEKGEDLFASVWGFAEFNCERFLTELPLATGLVDYRMHDNDLFGLRFCEIKNNMNAWGWSFHGTVYTPFGDKRQLSGHFWGLFDCDTNTFPVRKTKLVLTD